MPGRLQYDILKSLKAVLKSLESEQKSQLRDGFLSYEIASSREKKRSQFRKHHAQQRDYRLLKLNKLVKALNACIAAIQQKPKSQTALLSHLLTLQSQNEMSHELKTTLDIFINALTPFVKREQTEVDSFGNIGLHAQFESLLSLRMLEEFDPSVLQNINQRIIDYLKKHYKALLGQQGETIRAELIKFKIPFNSALDPVSALIELLDRPLQTIDERNIPQVICESFVLHLLMFNYLHIYDPKRMVDTFDKAGEIIDKRDNYHRMVRPKGEHGMFEEEVRGRINVYSKQKDRTLGITDEEYSLEEFEAFHQFDYTPFKYRSSANEDSPLVKHLRKKGIPFISGPSGTTADVIESLQFLYPEMTDCDYQTYLNLLAASEVALGHHSFAEVILTGTHAGVLPQVKLKNLGQPHWEQIDYTTMYRDFLTPEFKQSDAYASIKENYPWCLGEPHPLVKKDLIKKEKETRLALKVKQAFEERASEQTFKKAPYWMEAGIAPKKFSELHFIQALSNRNLNKLRENLGELRPEEMVFLHLFAAQPIVLTHYTNAAPAIKQSGHLLSHKGLSRRGIEFKDSSKKDIAKMQNADYVFFRFELEHRPFGSRFGDLAFSLDGRDPAIHPFLWISLTDMFYPLDPGVIDSVDYDDVTYRKGEEHNPTGGAIDEDDVVTTIRFDYPQTGEAHLFHVPDYVFMGEDLMEGIARSLLVELRRIGGKMREDYLSLFSLSTPFQDPKEILLYLNEILSSLFRVEGKIPRSVALQHVDFVESNVSILKDSAKTGNLMTFRKQLRHFPASVLEDIGEELVFEIINGGHDSLLAYLLGVGYELYDELLDYILIQFSFTPQALNYKFLLLFFDHGYGQAFIKYRDTNNSTLLHLFTQSSMTEEIDFLIEQGLSPLIKNNAEKTFIDCLLDSLQPAYRKKLEGMVVPMEEDVTTCSGDGGDALLPVCASM